MLGRFLGFGLNVKLAPEADLVLVLDGHLQQEGQVIQLPLHVRVE